MEQKKLLTEVISRYKDQVDYLEIHLEDSNMMTIDVKKSKVESINTDFIYGGNVRTLSKGGWGFVVFKDLAELEEAVKKSILQAKLVGKEKSYWAKVEPIEFESKITFINDPRKVSLEEKVKLLKDYSSLVDEYDERIITSQAAYREKFMNTIFANSEGSYIKQEKTDIAMAIRVTAVKDGNTQTGALTKGTCTDFNVFLGLEDKIKKECQLALDLLEAPRIKGGKYLVILNSDLTGTFVHEAFGHTMEADHIVANPSMQEILKIGTSFGSEILNIYDSGIIDDLRGSYHYDDEGTPAEKTVLLKEGILVGHLHSRETAAKLDEKPTGSARAISYQYPPIPRMRNTSIEPGSATFEEMIKDVELGVFAVDSKGGKGGENFSFTAHHGYMIRNGEIAELVQGFTLAGNLFKTLKDIDMVGNKEEIENSFGGCGKGEQFPLPVTSGGPMIRIQNVTIGGE
ncbi:MAG: TldD/PmbA family protein [Halanaerobiales bacterium]|nr:TldD/PmbA family protein [Halanaerobiales bacterium]